MEEFYKVISQILEYDTLPWILGISALLLLLFIYRSSLQQIWFGLKTRYCINRLGMQQISNVRCPDGLDDYFTIDRLILRPDGISLLKYKQYPGKIFCADTIDEWTQMLGQKSYKFKNPLFELEYQVKAISGCVPGVDIDGYLFFDHQSEFPKGHPDRVIHSSEVPDELKKTSHQRVDDEVLSAWRALKKMAHE